MRACARLRHAGIGANAAGSSGRTYLRYWPKGWIARRFKAADELRLPLEYNGTGISLQGQRLGLDVGIARGGRLFWGVFAPTTYIGPGALRGTYVGAGGNASLGLGLGANVLVGGSHRTISLQPLSVEGQVGINLALGVAGLTLY
jgi:hypothetical protein